MYSVIVILEAEIFIDAKHLYNVLLPFKLINEYWTWKKLHSQVSKLKHSTQLSYNINIVLYL